MIAPCQSCIPTHTRLLRHVQNLERMQDRQSPSKTSGVSSGSDSVSPRRRFSQFEDHDCVDDDEEDGHELLVIAARERRVDRHVGVSRHLRKWITPVFLAVCVPRSVTHCPGFSSGYCTEETGTLGVYQLEWYAWY